MINIVFTDTNKLVGLFFRVMQGKSIDESMMKILSHTKQYHFYISEYVVFELRKTATKYGITYTLGDIQEFFAMLEFTVIESGELDDKYTHYVSDIKDRQILQDAVSANANYILTNNTKDFNTTLIYNDFGIEVVSDLFEVC